MISFIDNNRAKYGGELICRVLLIDPSTFYRAQDLSDNPNKRSLRSQHDDFTSVKSDASGRTESAVAVLAKSGNG